MADRLARDARPRDAADVQRDREHPGRPRTRPGRVARRRHPGDRRRQSGRHRGGGREARRGARWRRRAAPRVEVGPRLRLPRRLPGRARPRLRRHDRDGRRPLARPGGAAGAGRRGRAGRRPRHRLALRARRLDPGLEVGPSRDLPRGWPLRPGHARPLGARRHRRVPRLRAPQPLAHRPRPGPRRRLRLPGRDDLPHRAQRRPHHRGPDRVPRPQSRALEDVEPHRGRGVPAGHLVGRPGPALSSRSPSEIAKFFHARH